MFSKPTSILAYVNTAISDEQNALSHAIYLAKSYGARLTLVDVVQTAPWHMIELSNAISELEHTCVHAAEEHLGRHAVTAREQGIEAEVKVLRGTEWHELLRDLETGDYDLFVKTRTPSDESALGSIGSTGMRIVRKSTKPVLIVHPEDVPGFEHIVVAVNPSQTEADHAVLSHKILDAAITYAKDSGARLSVLHAWQSPGESHFAARLPIDQYEMYFKGIREAAKQDFDSFISSHADALNKDQIHLIPGDPADIVPAYVEKEGCDLLVIGTVGRGGISGVLMGNTAESILRRVSCSVLALKPQDFVCPVKFS